MKVSVQASTGRVVSVWRAGALFHAALADGTGNSEVCVAVDLFEVIAELSGLDLERTDHAREALTLSKRAQAELLEN